MTQSVLIAVLVLLLFQTFFGVVYVNGTSMEPTFQNGNALLLRKWGIPDKGDIITAYIDELDHIVVKGYWRQRVILSLWMKAACM